jgi:hypothetical protein
MNSSNTVRPMIVLLNGNLTMDFSRWRLISKQQPYRLG